MIVDVNVLLYAVNENAENHEPIRSWLEDALDGDETVGLPWIVLLGFVRIATNPRVFSAPLPVDEALDRVEQWLDAHVVTIVGEKTDHWRALRGLLEDTGTAGNLTTDAHLAACAITHDATLVSCDGDFARFEDLRWRNPLNAARPTTGRRTGPPR
jgi:toxin-antitoxin system PIN domain toxin